MKNEIDQIKKEVRDLNSRVDKLQAMIIELLKVSTSAAKDETEKLKSHYALMEKALAEQKKIGKQVREIADRLGYKDVINGYG